MPTPAKIDTTQFNRPDSVLATASADVSGGQDETQTITITGAPGGGTFTISFAGQTTAAIAYNATGAQVQAALELLSTIGAGNVEVSLAGAVYTITFRGRLGHQNVAQVTTTNSFTGGSSPNTTIATAIAGAAGATSIPVTALAKAIPSGEIIQWTNGAFSTLTAAAAVGATALTVTALEQPILSGETTRYAGNVVYPNSLPSGTFIGRTFAERDSGTAFGPAATGDDEVFLTYFEIGNMDYQDDVELYRPGSLVAENNLPGWTDATVWTSGLKTKLRAAYQTTLGSDGVT